MIRDNANYAVKEDKNRHSLAGIGCNAVLMFLLKDQDKCALYLQTPIP